jgi:hypothetical protein
VYMTKLVPLSKGQIDLYFAQLTDPAEIVLALFGHVLPMGKIEKTKGYCKAHPTTNHYIMSKFIGAKHDHTSTTLKGGLWLNYGFSSDETIDPWYVLPCDYVLKQRDEHVQSN